MVELAQVHGIQVVLASVTPVCDCFQKLTDRRPPGKIIGLNGWLKEYAARAGRCIWITIPRWRKAGP